MRESEFGRTAVGKYHQKEDDHPQSSDEMCGRSPEEKAFRQSFYLCQYRGSGGGVSGNTFKPSVYQCEFSSPKYIWEHSEYKGQDPGQDDGEKAGLESRCRILLHEYEWKGSCDESHEETDQKGSEGRIKSVINGDRNRYQHKKGIDQ